MLGMMKMIKMVIFKSQFNRRTGDCRILCTKIFIHQGCEKEIELLRILIENGPRVGSSVFYMSKSEGKLFLCAHTL